MRHCLGLGVFEGACRHSSRASTSAVTPLRTTTAVPTSVPWLKASRAATWLAPIMLAIASKVRKAVVLRAR